MILGIGTDIVRVTRMRQSLDRYGERFARRLLAPVELEEFRPHKLQAHFLAKRFAAKEALVKAMGTGFRDGVKLSDIWLDHDVLGKPTIKSEGKTALWMRQMGVAVSHISLTDEDDYAVAFVILEAGDSKA